MGNAITVSNCLLPLKRNAFIFADNVSPTVFKRKPLQLWPCFSQLYRRRTYAAVTDQQGFAGPKWARSKTLLHIR